MPKTKGKSNEKNEKRQVFSELPNKSTNVAKQRTISSFYLQSPQTKASLIQNSVKKQKMNRKKLDVKITPIKSKQPNGKPENSPLLKWVNCGTSTNYTTRSSNKQNENLKDLNDFPDMKRSKRSLKRHSSDSFAKYGVNLPSSEYILEYKNQFRELKQGLSDLFDANDDFVEGPSLSFEEFQNPVKVLDCKHLTKDQLKVSLEENYQYLYDIFHGISSSNRHSRFQKEDFYNNFTERDLKFNTSMITFTFEQKQLALDFLYKHFDKSEYGSQVQYFFKVLLPELCTKIFMDTHKMTYEEATTYLNNRLVD